MYIRVKFEHFIKFQKENNTYYLDKKNKYYVYSPSKETILNGFEKVNEMFDGIETEYELQKTNNGYLILFLSKSGNEYRFDLLQEPNTNIYHLAFSLLKNAEYHELTNLNESNEVFGKLSYILQDLNKKLDVKEYCIGATGDIKKDRIYQYMMKFVKDWKKRKTNHYNLGWALYFTI